jgi:hypothetical protein
MSSRGDTRGPPVLCQNSSVAIVLAKKLIRVGDGPILDLALIRDGNSPLRA